MTSAFRVILRAFVRVVGAEEVGVAHEEALLVVVGVDEPAGDAVGAVAAHLVQLRGVGLVVERAGDQRSGAAALKSVTAPAPRPRPPARPVTPFGRVGRSGAGLGTVSARFAVHSLATALSDLPALHFNTEDFVESTTGAVAVGAGEAVPGGFRPCRCLTPRHDSVSSRRSSVGSRAGAPPVGSGGSSGAFAPGLSPAPVGAFPAPASSNPACRFPALGFPVAFVSRVMRPFKPGALSADRRPGIRRTARAGHIASAYSTSSSRTPVARAVASSVAVPSSRPSPSRD